MEVSLNVLVLLLLLFLIRPLSFSSDVLKNLYVNNSPSAFGVWLSHQRNFKNSSCGAEHDRVRRSINSGSPKSEETQLPLRCPPCEQLHCFRRQKRRRLQCPGGKTLDICDCCRVCAKVEGDLCGGQHDYLGKCDKALFCEAQAPQIVHVDRGGVMKTYTVSRGICKKVPENRNYSKSLHNSSSNYTCHPECNPRFCKKNPRAICSAKQCARSPRKCQEPCQHTSCRACKFVEPKLLCPKCSLDDYKCLRDFGRCIRKNTCQKKLYEYPCKTSSKNPKPKGQFMCQVPECATKS